MDNVEQMTRCCIDCGAKITACNGFVHAGDFLNLLDNQFATVREWCGRCGLKFNQPQ